MKSVTYILFSLFFISGSSLAGDQDKKAPKISFDQEEFDFGKVQGDTVLTHVFILSNLGSDTLNIEKVKPS